MNKIKRLALVALAGLGLSASGAIQDTEWWAVDFESPTSNGVEFVQGQLGNLTNDWEASHGTVDQPYDEGVWYAIDGDESYITNGIVTNVVGAVATETTSDYLKLDTQGNDLKWAPKVTAAVSNVITLVDADILLVGSDSPPDATDFDAAGDVQTAVYLRNYPDDDTGIVTNSLLCVYVYDGTAGKSYWQGLDGTPIDDNSWHHIRVLVDYTPAKEGDYASVQVFVDDMDTPMHADGDATKTSWSVANRGNNYKALTSVSFRGTGAVDNFVGKTREETFPTLAFAAEVYIDGVKQAYDDLESPVGGNLSRLAEAEAGDPGSGKTVEYLAFRVDDYDGDTATYSLRTIEIADFVGGTNRVFVYTIDDESGEVSVDIENNIIKLVEEEGEQTGDFDIKALTDGATDPTNVIAKIYFKSIGAYDAIATTTVGGTTTPDAKTVTPADFEGGATKTLTWTFNATEGDNILTGVSVQNGATATYEAGVATVTVTLDAELAADTVFANATYEAGSYAGKTPIWIDNEDGTYTLGAYLAKIAGTPAQFFGSLREAIAAADPGDTVVLLADDRVSFSATATEIGITKALTIDGGSNTLYGVTDYAYDGANDHDIYIGGSGDVTIKNLKISEFSDAAPTVQMQSYPIWTGQAYSGKLTLDGVQIDKFARTAINLSGGTFEITNCVIKGYADAETVPETFYQDAVFVYKAKGTVAETTVTGVGAANTGYGAAVFTVRTSGTGEITVLSGSYTGLYVAAVNTNATGSITIEGGTFVATNTAGEGEDPDSAFEPANTVGKIVVKGGWFDREPEAEFIAAGLQARKLKADSDPAPWTVVLANAVWVGGANGDWNVPANWDIGLVPTTTTVVTFTNDAQVAISGYDRCKEMVLTNAVVTLGGASGVAQPILRFYGDEKRAVSVATGATGLLRVNGISLFNEVKDKDDLTIGSGLEILGDVTFRGVGIDSSKSASFTITGKTTIANNVTVKTIDGGITTFQGDIDIASGAQVTFFAAYSPQGSSHGGEIVVASTVTLASPGTKLMLQTRNNGKITINDGQVVTDSTDYYVKKSSQQNVNTGNNGTVNQTTYEVLPKPTVYVTETGVTVAGVTNGERVTPGTNLTITVSGFAEGYEPSVTITNPSDSSVLLTTNAASFVYTMPEHGIAVAATAVLKTYTITFWTNGVDVGEAWFATNAPYGDTGYGPAADPVKAATDTASFAFAGWTNAVAGGAAVATADLPAATTNAAWAAVWTETPIWTVTFKNGDATIYETNYLDGATAEYVGETPTKDATAQYTFTFAGWDPALGAVTADTVYAATFSSNVVDYAITFWTNGVDVGEAWFATNAPYGTLAAAYAPTNDPVKAATATTSFAFAGWTNAVAGGAAVATADLPAVTADAAWAAVWTETPIWTVTFKNGDATIYETNYLDGATAEYVGETPTKDATAQYAFTFAGWDPALGAVTADTVYAATFSSNAVEYAIVYDLDGGQWPAGYVPTNSYTVESAEIVLPTPVKDGYEFNNWTNALGGAATGVAAGSTGAQSFGATWTATALDPVDPGESMTEEEKIAKPPVAVVTDDGGDVSFTVHFRGEEGVTYQLVASESCSITEEQWKGEATGADASGNAVVVDTATTADADQSGIITLEAPMSGNNVPAVRFFKIKASR